MNHSNQKRAVVCGSSRSLGILIHDKKLKFHNLSSVKLPFCSHFWSTTYTKPMCTSDWSAYSTQYVDLVTGYFNQECWPSRGCTRHQHCGTQNGIIFNIWCMGALYCGRCYIYRTYIWFLSWTWPKIVWVFIRSCFMFMLTFKT